MPSQECRDRGNSKPPLKRPAGAEFVDGQSRWADSPELRRRFCRRLLRWFDRSARDLPWRRSRDPYAIWVSEIMLQQTQVAAVIPYFNRFMAAFPTVADLAAAPEEKVLRQWEGLGYYSRARNLHQAARQVVQRYGGRIPSEPEELMSLAGIGRYTAGAIASIAFDRRAPILEANTRRVLTRLFAVESDPQAAATQEHLWSLAGLLLPRSRPGRFNQALMELGARVCTARAPACGWCPARDVCAAHCLGLEEALPKRGRKTRFEQVREAAAVVHRGGKILLVLRPPGGRWAGMWDFPRVVLSPERASDARRVLRKHVAEVAGVRVRMGGVIDEISYGVTRFRVTLVCFAAAYLGPANRGAAEQRQRRWVPPLELTVHPLPAPIRRLSRLVGQRAVSRAGGTHDENLG